MVGYEAACWIPQIPAPEAWFLASLTYPDSPHPDPQEFLTIQYGVDPSVPYPTKRTPWSNVVPQAVDEMIPPVYD